MLSPEPHSLTIRAKDIDGNMRFILYKNQNRLYSIRPAATTRNFLLQDSSRRILARFIPITPNTIVLRSEAGTQALIRAKEHPSVIGWAIESEISNAQKWLLAVLLYAIVHIEASESEPPPKQHEMEPETDSPEVDSP
jgi:hypothetical protein